MLGMTGDSKRGKENEVGEDDGARLCRTIEVWDQEFGFYSGAPGDS